MPELAYVNGVTTSLGDARIPVTNFGFQAGYGVFETMRVYQSHFFRLEAHLHRLASGADFLNFPIDVTALSLLLPRLLEESHLAEAKVRLSVSASKRGTASVIVTVENYRPPADETYYRGLSCIIASIRRRSDSPLSRYKTLNQLENLMAKVEAEKSSADEAIFLNECGQVAESNRANIFIVKDGVLKTPGLNTGILPGITRTVTLALAHKLKIPSFETDFFVDKLFDAEEAFISSSLVEIMPLTTIDGTRIGQGRIGPLTSLLSREYRELVCLETGHDHTATTKKDTTPEIQFWTS